MDDQIFAPPLTVEMAPDGNTAPFWAAAAEHRLVCAACATCGKRRMPPGPCCPRCRSTAVTWEDLPGTGTVYTFTVTMQAFTPSLVGHIPYIVALIVPDGAPDVRLVSNLVGVRVRDVTIGLTVQVTWADLPDGAFALPRFRPVAAT